MGSYGDKTCLRFGISEIKLKQMSGTDNVNCFAQKSDVSHQRLVQACIHCSPVISMTVLQADIGTRCRHNIAK